VGGSSDGQAYWGRRIAVLGEAKRQVVFDLARQARQESNLQPPVLERTPSNAGVDTIPDTEAQ